MRIKKNRVLGVRGISVLNGNLNADFNGHPKSLSDGTYMNSDVSTKFLDREYFKSIGEDVLITKHLKTANDGTIYAATLEEAIKDKLNLKENIYVQFLNFVDVQNFGATITNPVMFGVTGVVQYLNGVNKYEDAEFITQDILSPFGTGNNKNKSKKSEFNSIATNIGKHHFLERALYVQSFTVNPSNLNSLVPKINNKKFNGYTEESYQKFKKAVLLSSTIYTTRSKVGCNDEFAMFVNVKEDSLFTVPDLGRFIKVDRMNSKYQINFNELEFLNNSSEIESIEIFHNPHTSDIIHKFKNVEIKDSLSVFER